MKLSVQVDATRALAVCDNMVKRKGFAIANAINATAKLIQQAERARVASVFHLRDQKEFILRQAAIIKPFASPYSEVGFYARIAVGEKEGLLLPEFEAGGARSSKRGRNVAIPIVGGARGSITAPVPKDLYIRSLKFRRVKGGKGSGKWAGLQETYIVQGVGIFQRTGNTTKLLYLFKPTVRIPKRLEFIATGKRVAARMFDQLLKKEVDAALWYRFTGIKV